MSDIQLSEDDRAFIEERVRSGSYKTFDDVVHAGLRSLQRDETALRRLMKEAEDDIAAGRFYEFGQDDDLTEFIVGRAKARQA